MTLETECPPVVNTVLILGYSPIVWGAVAVPGSLPPPCGWPGWLAYRMCDVSALAAEAVGADRRTYDRPRNSCLDRPERLP